MILRNTLQSKKLSRGDRQVTSGPDPLWVLCPREKGRFDRTWEISYSQPFQMTQFGIVFFSFAQNTSPGSSFRAASSPNILHSGAGC